MPSIRFLQTDADKSAPVTDLPEKGDAPVSGLEVECFEAVGQRARGTRRDE
jgi:hypothetical protein